MSVMNRSRQNLKDLIRDEVRGIIQPLMDVIRLELQQAIEELRHNGKPKASRKR
jgi:hypothetical protein